MIYFLPLWLLASLSSGLFLRRTLPLSFNIWLRLLTGALCYILIRNNNLTRSLTLFIVEERISLFIILTWRIGGGGVLLVLLLAIKRGLAPFHLWVINTLSHCNRQTIIWAITIHKLPIVGIILALAFTSFLIPFTLRFTLGVLIIISFRRINRMLLLSSNNTFTSLIILLCLTPLRGLLFFLLYILLLWRTLNFLSSTISSLLLLFGFIGIPPLFLFQSKWIVTELLWTINSLCSILFVSASVISSIIYIRFVFLINFELFLAQSTIFFLAWAFLSTILPTV